MNPIDALQAAVDDFETKKSALSKADGIVTDVSATVSSIQAKLDAANSDLTVAQSSVIDAAKAFNASCDAIAAAATAAKRTLPA